MSYKIELTDKERIEMLCALKADMRWWQEFRPYSSEFRKKCLKPLASAYAKLHNAEHHSDCDCNIPYTEEITVTFTKQRLSHVISALRCWSEVLSYDAKSGNKGLSDLAQKVASYSYTLTRILEESQS